MSLRVWVRRCVLLIAVAALFTACGKKGPPRPKQTRGAEVVGITIGQGHVGFPV